MLKSDYRIIKGWFCIGKIIYMLVLCILKSDVLIWICVVLSLIVSLKLVFIFMLIRLSEFLFVIFFKSVKCRLGLLFLGGIYINLCILRLCCFLYVFIKVLVLEGKILDFCGFFFVLICMKYKGDLLVWFCFVVIVCVSFE